MGVITNGNDYKDQKFDVVLLIGQSNAAGCGMGDVENEYVADSDIMAIVDNHNVEYKTDENNELYLDIKTDTTFRIETAQETVNSANGKKTGCFGLIFARDYKKTVLKTGRKIIVVRAAIGGTGFVKKQWRVGDAVYNRAVEMTDAILALNSQNRLVACLWHQGECDAFESIGQSYELTKAEYAKNFGEFLNSLRVRYGQVPFIAGEFVSEWRDKNAERCQAVLDATTERISVTERAAFVKASDLKSNNQELADGDDIHFCKRAQYELGKRYFDAFCNLIDL